ncbi:MAG: MFS transporter [Pseudomonadota bacterium]
MNAPDNREPELRSTTFDSRSERRVTGGLLALVLVVLVGSALWVSQQALTIFNDMLLPQFDQDGEIIAERLAVEIDRALSLGIPLDELRGTEDFLESYLDQHSALIYLALADSNGDILAAVGPNAGLVAETSQAGLGAIGDNRLVSLSVDQVRETALRIGSAQDPAAFILVGLNKQFAQSQISDMRWDIVVVLVVSLLVALEVLVFLIDRTIVTPLRLIDRIKQRALHGEWTVRPRRREASDEIGATLSTIDRLGHEVSDTLLRIDRKLARLTRVPPAIAERVDGLHRRVRLYVDEGQDNALQSRANARLPLFLFVFAEELSRSFLPLYAEQIYRPIVDVPYLGAIASALGLGNTLSAEIVIGLPIIVFMAAVAIATPFGGAWVSRFGSRTMFLVGAIPAAVGYLGTAFAVSTYDMLFWRLLSAIGYALITIACQGYLANIGSGSGRARNMAVYVAAVTTAVICGSAIGAVLADRFGFRATFVISAGFVVLASTLASRYMRQYQATRVSAQPRIHTQFRALANPRFLALIIFAAIPAKIALTGFLFFMIPLFLNSIDFTQPAIGRMIMIYGILMLVGTQLGARIHDRSGYGLALIAVGGLLTGIALAGPGLIDSGMIDLDLMIPITIGLFGLAQGVASAPMLAIIPHICPAETKNFGLTSLVALLRLTERIGSVVGPFLAAFLVVGLGYVAAIATIGIISAATAVIFVVVTVALSTRKLPDTKEVD